MTLNEFAESLNITVSCAQDVLYLRTRNRHTPELEAELIRLHRAGTPPNIMDFGVTAETQAAMMNAVQAELIRQIPNIDINRHFGKIDP